MDDPASTPAGGEHDDVRERPDDPAARGGAQDLMLVQGGFDAEDDGLDARLRVALSSMLNDPVPEEFLRIIAPLKAR
jgi:hypothetical protein